jgi:hypothetical protein
VCSDIGHTRASTRTSGGTTARNVDSMEGIPTVGRLREQGLCCTTGSSHAVRSILVRSRGNLHVFFSTALWIGKHLFPVTHTVTTCFGLELLYNLRLMDWILLGQCMTLGMVACPHPAASPVSSNSRGAFLSKCLSSYLSNQSSYQYNRHRPKA